MDYQTRNNIKVKWFRTVSKDTTWSSLAEFSEWMMEQGFQPGVMMWLKRLDDGQPYGPENCFLMTKEQSEELARKKRRLRDVWRNMHTRVKDSHLAKYKAYEKVSICQEWQNFQPFCKWALENKWVQGQHLDRINNDGNYEPGNCRFIDRTGNMVNREERPQYAVLTSDGLTHASLSDANKFYNIKSNREISEAVKTGKHFWDRRNVGHREMKGRVKLYAWRQDYLI